MTSLSAVFNVQREAWMDQSVCRGEDPKIFILDQGYTTTEAVKFCRRCPVTEACADYARRTASTGVWGGKLFSRETYPIELLPIQRIQDGRPKPSNGTSVIKEMPGILGIQRVFEHPGILGIAK